MAHPHLAFGDYGLVGCALRPVRPILFPSQKKKIPRLIILLLSRPNLSDQCLKGTLTFANGKIVKFGTLANNGAATPVAIVPSISTTTLSWQCDSVSASTENVGLMEIAVYGSAASPS